MSASTTFRLEIPPVFVFTEKLTKAYPGVIALDGCSLQVERGEVFGLLGPNGAGKTTLIRLLLGYLRPTSGAARIGGLNCVTHSVQVRTLVSYLPAEAALFPHMRAKEVLQFFADIRPGGSVARSLALAERLDLDLKRTVGFMSTGMKQKLALAATMGAVADLYILDEPTANLDPTVRSTVLSLVAEAQQAGKTVMFSSHVLSEVEEVCNRVVILRSGKLVHTQVMNELRQRHRIVATLTGSLPDIPPHLTSQLEITSFASGVLQLETAGELSPLLGWLAQLSLADVRVEPVGLRAIYDQYHFEGGIPRAKLDTTTAPSPEKELVT